MNKEMRIIFKTADGVLVMERTSTLGVRAWSDDEFVEYSLGIDARERGVKIVKKTVDKKNGLIVAVVAWL